MLGPHPTLPIVGHKSRLVMGLGSPKDHHLSCVCLFIYFWSCFAAWGILVPWPGMEPVPPALECRVLPLDLQGSPYLSFRPINHLQIGNNPGNSGLVGRCFSQDGDISRPRHLQLPQACIGEGNGTPLQYSCLENPRDGGAWWAAVYGVAQSRTRLKWLSSSSSSTSSHHLINFLKLKHIWLWERLKAGGESGGRGWDGWIASLTQWTWVWANSGRQRRTGKPACCSPWCGRDGPNNSNNKFRKHHQRLASLYGILLGNALWWPVSRTQHPFFTNLVSTLTHVHLKYKVSSCGREPCHLWQHGCTLRT